MKGERWPYSAHPNRYRSGLYPYDQKGGKKECRSVGAYEGGQLGGSCSPGGGVLGVVNEDEGYG